MSIESRSVQYGSIFGQWHIEKLLGTGSGGKSAVFSIYRDNGGWREYSALKVICLIEEYGSHEELTALRKDEFSTAVREQRSQADQEVRLMDQLRGKTNIVDYLDHRFHSWHDDTGFGVDLLIRMEKLTDLRSRMRRGEILSQQEILRVGQDICQALAICHGKNILHRDIKPENIFFNEDGDYKLGDFGISRILDNSQAMASTGIGTLPYLAPEQTSGSYDERVDIYSLGLVLYELANFNRLPFADSGYIRESQIRRRLSGEALPVPQGVSPGLARVILTACAFRPEDRFRNAWEMLEALEAAASEAGDYPSRPQTRQLPLFSTAPAEAGPAPGPYSTAPAVPSGPYDTVPVEERILKPRTGGGKGKLLLPLALLAVLIGLGAFLLLRPEEDDPAPTDPPVQTSRPTETAVETLPTETVPATQQTLPTAHIQAPEVVIVETPLVALKPSHVNGNLYVFLSDGRAEDVPYTPYVTVRYVTDNFGNSYTFSIHADGPTAAERSITYDLAGEYTRFRGYIVFLSFADNARNNKPVQIYCDDELVFSAIMSSYSEPAEFDIDVTGVQTLRIVYPSSNGSNDQAAVCDAWLEAVETP